MFILKCILMTLVLGKVRFLLPYTYKHSTCAGKGCQCAGRGRQCAGKCRSVQARVVSVQASVIKRGRVLGLLPGRLSGACGYLGGEDFMRLEDLKANCKWEWTCDTVLGVFGGTIGNR